MSQWSTAVATYDGPEPAHVAAAYFRDSLLDDIEIVPNDGYLDACYAQRCRSGADAPTVLLVGLHDMPEFQGNPDAAPEAVVDSEGYRGRGVASRIGSLVAAVEGYLGATAEAGGDGPVNLRVLTLGEHVLGTGNLRRVLGQVPLDDIESIIMTSAISWELAAPTITVGARGRLLADVTVSTGPDLADVVFAGAARNSLDLLTRVLGSLRDKSGRIAIPGFYHRATPPTPGQRAAMERDGFDPSRWISTTGAVIPTSGPSPLERASAWPAINVLSVESGASERAGNATIPGSATALLSMHLVPDQRPIEIEAALRSWIESRMPAGVSVDVTVREAARPYKTPHDHPSVVAQARSLKRVFGKAPVPVVAGGTTGSGELADYLNVPVLFSGLASPASHFGTPRERLSRSRFGTGVNLNGEFFQQLRRRGRLQSIDLATGA